MSVVYPLIYCLYETIVFWNVYVIIWYLKYQIVTRQFKIPDSFIYMNVLKLCFGAMRFFIGQLRTFCQIGWRLFTLHFLIP